MDYIKIEDIINDETFKPNEWYGFVYLIEHIPTGKKYIGKKNFYSVKNKKLLKREKKDLPINRGRKPTKKQVITESDWKEYYSSSDEIKSLPKNELNRYIIKLCKSSKELSYYETKFQFEYGVLEKDNWFNNNILGKFFRKDLLG